MSSTTLPQGQVKQWHVILFVIVAGLLTLLVFYGGILDLLLLSGQSGFPSEIHRWHEGQAGTLMVIVFGGSLLALLWRPQSKPLLAQFMVLSIAILSLAFAAVSGAGFNPLVLAIGAVLIGILVAAYPKPRDLVNVRREGSLSYPLLAITLIAAIFLAPIIARELNYQILGMTEHDVAARLCRELGDHRWNPGDPLWLRIPRLNLGGGTKEQARDRFWHHRHVEYLVVESRNGLVYKTLIPKVYIRRKRAAFSAALLLSS